MRKLKKVFENKQDSFHLKDFFGGNYRVLHFYSTHDSFLYISLI